MPFPCQRYLLQAHSQMCSCWLPRWQGWCFLKWPCILLRWSESWSAEMHPKNGFFLPGLALRLHGPASCLMRFISREANWDLTQAESVLIRKFKDRRSCHSSSWLPAWWTGPRTLQDLVPFFHLLAVFSPFVPASWCWITVMPSVDGARAFTVQSVSPAGLTISATPCATSAQTCSSALLELQQFAPVFFHFTDRFSVSAQNVVLFWHHDLWPYSDCFPSSLGSSMSLSSAACNRQDHLAASWEYPKRAQDVLVPRPQITSIKPLQHHRALWVMPHSANLPYRCCLPGSSKIPLPCKLLPQVAHCKCT